ncbi:alpha-amylase family glycosyl hydrolase [Clostridium sp. BJN0001]|uniref:alpha-amylase family glycosyl hydrolase n=1 Tax=Clostridium sp. BJN0001 TaxID=2930219 RepID=UPI001FD4207B|nr:alpha-amylase family glycosyl hydrolase [Clostridium sp. BJN0001]
MKNWLNSLYSDGSKYFVSNPLPKKGEEITIKIRTFSDAPIDGIFLRTKLNGVERLFEMKDKEIKDGLCYYSCKVTCYEDMLHYHFYILTKDKIYYYTQMNITDYMPDETYDFKILYNYDQPQWVKNAVFYQIFPERFCNGNKENDVKTGEYKFDGYEATKVDDWDKAPENYEKAHCLDFYGGDLEGIIQKIPYLKELGVTALYLNPIFYAATVHKYDCLDYFHVDPHFGGDEALAELSKKLHENGMKLIIDVSINHTGTANKWFNKEGIFFDKSVGAYNNKDSKERKYYFFNNDNTYKAWFDVETLPTLNYTSQELRDVIFASEDSLVKKWLKPPYNIDGWRFDVADIMARNDEIQLHHVIWPKIRKSIKEVNKDAYVLAEDWCDQAEFLKGNEWDSAMNYYGFGRPVRCFVGESDLHQRNNEKLLKHAKKDNARMFSSRIKEHLFKLPFTIWQNQFNLFDSHDTPRLHNNKDISFNDYRAAVIMLFTMVGAADMYYGDEASIDGRIDETEGCRYPMPWSKNYTDSETFKLYKNLAHLKTSEEALSDGGFKILSDDDYVFSFARFTQEDLFIVICSTDDEERKVKIDTRIFGKEASKIEKDILNTKISSDVQDGNLVVSVQPHTSYLLKL